MIERLIAELGEKLDLTAEELADIIWLTLKRQQGTITDPTASKAEVVTVVEQNSVEQNSSAKPGTSSPPPETASMSKRQPTTEPAVGIAPRRSQTTPLNRLPIKVANPSSIRDPLALARSLRPLMRRVPSGQIEGLDEQATAQQIAEAGIWQPIVKPALEPWLELELVADESASMLIWRQTVLEFRKLLRNYGAFRDVQLWGLYWASERLCLRPGIGSEALQSATRQPKEILDPSGRRLIVLITDCVAAHWQSKALMKTLKLWSQHSPVAIAQVLPEWLWVRTAIRGFEPVQLTALEPGAPNSQLVTDWSSVWQAELDGKAGVCVPIVPLEPDSILTWSQMVIGQSEAPGYWLQAFPPDTEEPKPASLSPEQRVERFRVMSSPVAQRLIGLVAASPVITLPVIRLIQETLLPQSRQMNVAEVLLGGLLEPINPLQLGTNPDEVEYRFVDEAIRDLLLAETPVADTVRVLSEYVERQFDKSLDEFVAELQVWSQSEDAALVGKTRPFATVTALVLKRKGGKYREFVQQIERQYSRVLEQDLSGDTLAPHEGAPNHQDIPTKTIFPALQTFKFQTARIVFEVKSPMVNNQPERGSLLTIGDLTIGDEFPNSTPMAPHPMKLIIQPEASKAQYYPEDLGNGIILNMVLIPGGTFLMGSPEDEPERSDRESPQHAVTVPPIFMAQFPVTQAQWQAVADLRKVNQDLKPNPSRFKGGDRPVENVSWHDATQFCRRLAQKTGRPYRLPSEAEWEYAARAGTTTPFYFGETITTDLANYDGTDDDQGRGSGSYGRGPKGIYRKETTSVGSFPANGFGLYDMHGNVWEWCEDHWHGNYEGAPNDGSAWIGSEENVERVRRGGSWYVYPRNCRSAARNLFDAGFRSSNDVGFRVVCGAPRTL